MIDYRQLQAIAVVLKHGSFDKAAKHLNLTQSAISRRIAQLEFVVGAPVIIRSKPPKPTNLGTKLLNHLQQVRQLEVALGVELPNEMINAQNPLSVTLATNADSLATWLPDALVVEGFDTQQFLSFDITVVDQSVGLNKMKSGEVMICICDKATPVNGGLATYLGELEYTAVASPEFIKRHKLEALQSPKINAKRAACMKRLAQLPCLIFDGDDQLQHEFLALHGGTQPEYFHYCPSSEGFKQSALAGLGYGLLPVLQIKDLLDDKLLLPLIPDFTLNTPLYWHYWQTESPQLSQLRKHAVNTARKLLKQNSSLGSKPL